MTTAELIAHLKATAEQYYADAQALRDNPRGVSDETLAVRYDGKADAYFVAASWMEEYL